MPRFSSQQPGETSSPRTDESFSNRLLYVPQDTSPERLQTLSVRIEGAIMFIQALEKMNPSTIEFQEGCDELVADCFAIAHIKLNSHEAGEANAIIEHAHKLVDRLPVEDAQKHSMHQTLAAATLAVAEGRGEAVATNRIEYQGVLVDPDFEGMDEQAKH